jgi:hypothetical protein
MALASLVLPAVTHAFSMHGVRGAAQRATVLAKRALLQADAKSQIHDVQDDPRFQHRGVDLLWDRPTARALLGVEVKGDRQGSRRGRYFFELVSNFEKNTPGCFLYSTADLLLYVALDANEVHLLQFPQVRAWFLQNAKNYPLKAAQTKSGPVLYTTLGAPVPMDDVKQAIPHAVDIVKIDIAK